MHIMYYIAGWSSSEARRAHNPKVAGSNPAPATKLDSVEPPVQLRTSTEFFDTFIYYLSWYKTMVEQTKRFIFVKI